MSEPAQTSHRFTARVVTALVCGLVVAVCVPSTYRTLSYAAGSRTVTATVLSCEQNGRNHTANVRYVDATGVERTGTVTTVAVEHEVGAPGSSLELLELTHWPHSLTPKADHGVDVVMAWTAGGALVLLGLVLSLTRGRPPHVAEDPPTP